MIDKFTIHLTLQQHHKCFYTTPIKTLSNQKYADLITQHGAEQIGLLTNDNSINNKTPIVVMTTKMLHNMIYATSPTLLKLGSIIINKMHYLTNQFRKTVWEEVIIHLPKSVSLISLSATMSNTKKFGE